ncbi:MAG: L,D-transpeptidase family protein [Sedimentisphaerales bacterium]|nr:L,D-transpeptidase family protein [Sedimentisphaerales bacterium]
MKERYPSRMYISPRTRYWRKIYFGAAALVIVAISIATLYSLSDKSEKSKAEQAPTGVEQAEPVEDTKEAPVEQERFSIPLEIQTKPEEVTGKEHQAAETETEPVAEPETEAMPQEIEIAPEPDEEISGQAGAAAIIAEAKKIIASEPMKIIQARDMLNEVLPMPITKEQKTVVKQMLSVLADKWLFSGDLYPGDELCGFYKVQSGELLSTIGKNNNVPWEILQQINKLYSPESLKAGQSIKVIRGPFHARVYKSTFTMDVYLQDTFVRSFPVGLGKPEHDTPTGLWRVRPSGKLVKPRWTDPDTGRVYEPSDQDYPLGSRWISLEGLEGDAVGRTGFAIHGTKNPEEIGAATSRGCIRLHNGNAILVYNLVMPGVSKVEIVE